MQFVKSIGNIITWLQSPNFKSSHVDDVNDVSKSDSEDSNSEESDSEYICNDCDCERCICECHEDCEDCDECDKCEDCLCDECKCDCHEDDEEPFPIRDDSNDVQDEEKVTTVFTRSEFSEEQPQKSILNCSCRGEDKECDGLHLSSTTYLPSNEEYEKYLNDTFDEQVNSYLYPTRKGFNAFDENGQPTILPSKKSNYWDYKPSKKYEDQVVNETAKALERLYSNVYPDGFVASLKYLGYYNININQEKLKSQFNQLTRIIDFSEVCECETLEDLFQKYNIQPFLENIEKKIARSFQLSKYIGSNNWIGFANDLTSDEIDYLLDGFDNWSS